MTEGWFRRTLVGVLVLGFPLAAIAVLADRFASPTELRVVINFLIALVLVLAIQLFSGNSGIVSFGHVGFMGIGAYVAALLTIPPGVKTGVLAAPAVIADHNLDPNAAVFVAIAIAGMTAALIGIPITRMQEDAMAMATFAVLVIFFVVFESWDSVTGGAIGIFGIPVKTTVFSALAFALLGVVVTRLFRESKVGLKLRASRADPVAAEALGANVVWLRWIAWTFSGALMGMGGAIWAEYNLAFSPLQFYYAATFTLLSMLVVGGISTVSGAVVGAAVISVAFEILRRIEQSVHVQGLQQMVVAVVILIMLYRRPDGLIGRVEIDETLTQPFRWGRKTARRYGVRRGISGDN